MAAFMSVMQAEKNGYLVSEFGLQFMTHSWLIDLTIAMQAFYFQSIFGSMHHKTGLYELQT